MRVVFALIGALLPALSLAAAPLPQGALQYDEVTRVVTGTATPPPPGNFAADYRRAMSASPAPPAAGARSLSGRVVRYTISTANEWIRIDDPVNATAVIAKCDTNEVLSLDLPAKTYTIGRNTLPYCAPAGSNVPYVQRSSAAGTEDLNIDLTTIELAPRTIDGVPTTASSTNVTVAVSHATGSCGQTFGAADLSLAMTVYMSDISQGRTLWRASAPSFVMDPMKLLPEALGGCAPNVHLHADVNMTLANAFDLAMYTLVSTQTALAGTTVHVNQVTERGNVHIISAADAADLFQIPPGFTETK